LAGGWRRPVSAIEHGYLAAAPLIPPFAVTLVVEGTGTVEPGALEAAVRTVAATSRATGLRRHGRYWADSGTPPPILSGPAAPDQGDAELRAALTRACEVLHAPGRLVFRASHAVMDGRSVVVWAADVFRVLRGEEPLGRAHAQTEAAVRREIAGRAPRLATPLRHRDPLLPQGFRGGSDRRYAWWRRTAEGAPQSAVARVTAALADCAGRPVRVMVPVDLRRHVGNAYAMGNLALPIFLDAEPGTPWQSLHRDILAALHRRRELSRTAAEALGPLARAGFAAADTLSRRSGRYVSSAVVSGVGRLDPAELTAPGFAARTAYLPPTHPPFSPLAITFLSPGPRTELAVSYHPSGAERVASLLDSLEEALTQR
jgi:hypothetical protein